ncbi:MAG: hypothetical protein V1913_17015 [Fibrobacterota bacterium]
MTGCKTLAALTVTAALMLAACSEDKKVVAPGDVTPPSFIVDTMKAGGVVLVSNDTTLTDAVVLKGRVSDEGGIDEVTASVGGVETPAIVTGDSVWTVTVYLRSGLTTLTLTAEDEAGNTVSAIRKLYYRTNYMPLDSASHWKLARGADTLSIKVDSLWKIGGVPYRFYKMTLNNPDDAALDTLVFAQDTVSGNVRSSDTGWYQATLAPNLFLKEYTSATADYGPFTVRFIGDTTFNMVDFRNVVKLTYVNASNWLVYISDYYLAPGLGFVHLTTRQTLPFNLVMAP